MKRIFTVFAAIALLALLLATVAYAGKPGGTCPSPFEAHTLEEHEAHHNDPEHADHLHNHVGNDSDRNGDGVICVQHVGKDGKVHVHIDNNAAPPAGQ